MDVSAASEILAVDDEDALGISHGPAQANLVNGDSDHLTEGSKEETKAQCNIDSTLQAWNLVDFDSLKTELEKAAQSLGPYAEKTQESRVAVVEQTKEVRKRNKELLNRNPDIKDLLKGYQSFIDHLTSHNSILRSAFFQAFDPLSRAPDPYKKFQEFEHAIIDSETSRIDATYENERLQRVHTDLTRQATENQRQRDECRTAYQKLQDGQEAKEQEVEKAWRAVMEEKRGNWEAREQHLEHKISMQERLLSELKANYEVSQRLDEGDQAHGKSSQGVTTYTAELDLANSELERISSRLVDIEGRNEHLRQQLAEATSSVASSSRTDDKDSEERLRTDNIKLLRRLDDLQAEKAKEERRRLQSLEETRGTIKTLQQEQTVLHQKLKSREDYEIIQSELRALKAVEFASFEDEELPAQQNPSTQVDHDSHKSQQNNLERLLVAKNQKMNNDMAELRVAHQELIRKHDELVQNHQSIQSELNRSQAANTTLEADLVRLQQGNANGMDVSAMSVAGTYSSRYPTSSFKGRRGRTSPTSSILSGFDPSTTSRQNLDALRAGEPVGGGSGILPMIQAQRDRFKQKNSQLEEEVSKQNNMISSLRQEVSSLQKDNLNLYEKTRFVSTYSRGHQASSTSDYARSPPATSVQSSSDYSFNRQHDGRYKSAYEANISPFARFRGGEATRAYKRMPVHERIIFSITRMVLSNRTSRNFFAGYCMALHVLIFVMLYWMTTADHIHHASHLGMTSGGGSVGADAATDLHHGDWQPEGFHANAE